MMAAYFEIQAEDRAAAQRAAASYRATTTPRWRRIHAQVDKAAAAIAALEAATR